MVLKVIGHERIDERPDIQEPKRGKQDAYVGGPGGEWPAADAAVQGEREAADAGDRGRKGPLPGRGRVDRPPWIIEEQTERTEERPRVEHDHSARDQDPLGG